MCKNSTTESLFSNGIKQKSMKTINTNKDVKKSQPSKIPKASNKSSNIDKFKNNKEIINNRSISILEKSAKSNLRNDFKK